MNNSVLQADFCLFASHCLVSLLLSVVIEKRMKENALVMADVKEAARGYPSPMAR